MRIILLLFLSMVFSLSGTDKLLEQYRKLPDEANLGQFLEILNPLLDREIKQDLSLKYTAEILSSGKLDKPYENSSPADRKKLSEFCDRFRQALPPVPRAPYPKNLHELERRQPEELVMRHYYDIEKICQLILATNLEYLRLTADFFRKNPDAYISREKSEDWISFHIALAWDQKRVQPYQIMQLYPNELAPFIKEAGEHPIPTVQGIGLILALHGNTINGNFDPEKFRRNFEEFALAFAALQLKPVADKDVLYNLLWDRQFLAHAKLTQIAREISAKTIPDWQVKDSDVFMAELAARQGDELVDFVIANKDKCIKYEEELRSFPVGGHFRRAFPYLLLQLVQRDEVFNGHEALAIFNRRMDIRQLMFWKEEDGIRCAFSGGVVNGKNLFITASNYKTLIVYKLNCENDTVQELYKLNTRQTGYSINLQTPFGYGHVLDCNGELLAVGVEGAIHLFAADGSRTWTITDLPAPDVNALAWLDGRLYVWSGIKRRGSSSKHVFWSCDAEGKDRKIINDSANRDSQRDFPVASRGMVADPAGHRLFFLSYDKFHEYNPATGVSKLLLEKPRNMTQWDGESVLMQTAPDSNINIAFGGELFIFNPRTNSSELIFTAMPNAPPEIRYHYPWSNNGQFLIMGNYLWSGFHCLQLSPGKINEIYFYPVFEEKSRLGFSRLFPAPDGKSVYCLRGSDLLKLTPQDAAD